MEGAGRGRDGCLIGREAVGRATARHPTFSLEEHNDQSPSVSVSETLAHLDSMAGLGGPLSQRRHV